MKVKLWRILQKDENSDRREERKGKIINFKFDFWNEEIFFFFNFSLKNNFDYKSNLKYEFFFNAYLFLFFYFFLKKILLLFF